MFNQEMSYVHYNAMLCDILNMVMYCIYYFIVEVIWQGYVINYQQEELSSKKRF